MNYSIIIHFRRSVPNTNKRLPELIKIVFTNRDSARANQTSANLRLKKKEIKVHIHKYTRNLWKLSRDLSKGHEVERQSVSGNCTDIGVANCAHDDC